MKIIKGILYWVWSYTWGILLTLVGTVGALIMLITGHKPHRFHYNIYFMVGKTDWGGLEMGPFFFTDKRPTLHIKQHESGHGLQNLIFGPFGPFLVNIPSALRYWFREMRNETQMTIYTCVTTFVFLLPGIAAIICGVLFNIMWLWIVGGVWCLYFFIVCCIWQATEIPKYRKRPWPDYDNFWAEGMASKWGAKCFPNDN